MKAKTYFKEDSFTDKEGNVHFITLAAALQDTDAWGDDLVFFGLSVCNPHDHFSPDLGRSIAEGRAKKYSSCFGNLTCTKGLLSISMIQDILDRNVEYIKHNPTLYYKGKKQLLKT